MVKMHSYLSAPPPVGAQQYPGKVVRIVTSEPGSTTEILARVAAQGLALALGRQVIVDNRGTFGAEHVAKQPPDGYTINKTE